MLKPVYTKLDHARMDKDTWQTVLEFSDDTDFLSELSLEIESVKYSTGMKSLAVMAETFILGTYEYKGETYIVY